MIRGTIIIRNRARCKNCGDVIESKSVHDWVCCSCFKNEADTPGIFIDGGHNYVRCGGNLDNLELLTETRPFTDAEVDSYNDRKRKAYERYGFEYEKMEK